MHDSSFQIPWKCLLSDPNLRHPVQDYQADGWPISQSAAWSSDRWMGRSVSTGGQPFVCTWSAGWFTVGNWKFACTTIRNCAAHNGRHDDCVGLEPRGGTHVSKSLRELPMENCSLMPHDVHSAARGLCSYDHYYDCHSCYSCLP